MAYLPPAPTPQVQACLARAHARYDAPVLLLRAILAVEGGRAGTESRNANGTQDLGWAQINTSWLPVLRKAGITKADLLYDPCVNIGVSAWILRLNFQQYGNWRQAIEAYNAGNELQLGRNYAQHVVSIWDGLWRARNNDRLAASNPG